MSFNVILAKENEHSEFIVNAQVAMAQETEGLLLDMPTVRQDPQYGHYMVALDPATQAVVGCLMITYEWSDWRNGLCHWIQSVFVRRDFRRRGCFSDMYQEAKKNAKAVSAAGLRLYVDKLNATAKQTYLKCGMLVANYDFLESMFE